MSLRARLRPAFVVTAVGASVAAAACASTCPKQINAGDPCSGTTECKLKDGCGVNGYRCRDGVWEAMMTHCNPPGPATPEVPPSVADAAAVDAGVIEAGGHDAARVDTGAHPDASTAVASGCPSKPITIDMSCATEGLRCQEKSGCGSNGFQCSKGKWRELFTTCNPPAPAPTK